MCKFQVSSDDRQEYINVEALTVPEIPIQASSNTSFNTDWPHLRDLQVPTVSSAPIEIVIGTDCPEMFWSLEERRAGRKEPIARKTLLGWIVLGPSSQVQESSVNISQVDPLQEQLTKMWNVDFQDVKSTDPVLSVDDKTALKSMNESVQMVNGKFMLGIPWKNDPETSLPNNRSMAESRLRMLKRKFSSNAKLAEDYKHTVETYIADGHARLVSASESKDSKQWFLPHHAVFKKSNPSKCRVVFDCAAQYKGVSLNDVILQGPNHMNNLAGVLICFLKEQVAVVADIKLMFHQCFVPSDDQRFLSFLWWPKGDTSSRHDSAPVWCHIKPKCSWFLHAENGR